MKIKIDAFSDDGERMPGYPLYINNVYGEIQHEKLYGCPTNITHVEFKGNSIPPFDTERKEEIVRWDEW